MPYFQLQLIVCLQDSDFCPSLSSAFFHLSAGRLCCSDWTIRTQRRRGSVCTKDYCLLGVNLRKAATSRTQRSHQDNNMPPERQRREQSRTECEDGSESESRLHVPSLCCPEGACSFLTRTKTGRAQDRTPWWESWECFVSHQCP